jgi:hypothetical protein
MINNNLTYNNNMQYTFSIVVKKSKRASKFNLITRFLKQNRSIKIIESNLNVLGRQQRRLAYGRVSDVQRRVVVEAADQKSIHVRNAGKHD